MRKNNKYISISEYCKSNGLKLTKFYETLRAKTAEQGQVGIFDLMKSAR